MYKYGVVAASCSKRSLIARAALSEAIPRAHGRSSFAHDRIQAVEYVAQLVSHIDTLRGKAVSGGGGSRAPACCARRGLRRTHATVSIQQQACNGSPLGPFRPQSARPGHMRRNGQLTARFGKAGQPPNKQLRAQRRPTVGTEALQHGGRDLPVIIRVRGPCADGTKFITVTARYVAVAQARR